jgi:hypothetical protein
MEALRALATADSNGEVTLRGLRLNPGEVVEVIVLRQNHSSQAESRYPLRGEPIVFIDPTEPVAEGDWDATR